MFTPLPTAPFRLATAALLLALCAAPAAAAPEDALPPGPKQLLAGVVGDDTAALADILGASRSSADWQSVLAGVAPALDETQLAVLADYLAYALPPATPAEGANTAALIAALPSDGKQLFVEGCLGCHGAVSYYLLEDRDFEGWLAIFDAPYHRRLFTEANEREIFASYAAWMMPIAEADIPEEWREQ